jgi:hypothetical protein
MGPRHHVWSRGDFTHTQRLIFVRAAPCPVASGEQCGSPHRLAGRLRSSSVTWWSASIATGLDTVAIVHRQDSPSHRPRCRLVRCGSGSAKPHERRIPRRRNPVLLEANILAPALFRSWASRGSVSLGDVRTVGSGGRGANCGSSPASLELTGRFEAASGPTT